jgi:hypothetical protein
MIVAKSNANRAKLLIHFNVAAFVHKIVNGPQKFAEWRVPAVNLISEIADWSEDLAVRFVASPFVEWVCEQLRCGSWSNRGLGLRFFLRLLKFRQHATIVECIAQSDFLRGCVAVIGSDDVWLEVQILHCFVEIWDGCLRGLYAHPFFRKVTGLIEDEEFLEGVAAVAGGTDFEVAEAAQDVLRFLAGHGIAVDSPE